MIAMIRFLIAVPFLFLGIIGLGLYCLIAGNEASQALVDALERQKPK